MGKKRGGSKVGPESLSQYVKRVIEEKALTLHDVELLSGKRITDTYVSNIISGEASNPSIDKIQALARGLGVEVLELFKAAVGKEEDESGVESQAKQPDKAGAEDATQALMVVRMMEKVVLNEILRKIVRRLMTMSDEELESVHSFILSRQEGDGSNPYDI
ncbi:MAG TPA: helix-turn-helix transcriptional regulator [Blastocatellia bacterium]|nr:helix-turn-helix transcriptional regulator [Blastocatellia bacterium]